MGVAKMHNVVFSDYVSGVSTARQDGRAPRHFFFMRPHKQTQVSSAAGKLGEKTDS